MARQDVIEIGEHSIELGESREIYLKFSESYLGEPVTIPIYVMRAEEHGPCLFITAVIHGDELNGMGVVRELFLHRPPDLKCGTIIALPVVNVPGIERHARYMPDRRDLNRSFPGSDKGSFSGRLAHAIFSQIIQLCDYGIDIHTAAVRRTNYPNIRANMKDERVKALAEAFGTEMIVHGAGPKRSLRRTATDQGVPTIVVEAGEVWKIEPGVVEIGVRGCLNVMQFLGMIDGEPKRPLFQASVTKTTWIRSERGGIVSFHAQPGEFVTRDQHLATTHSIFGGESDTVRSPANGIVLGMSTLPMVKPGEPLYHIAVLSKKRLRQIEGALMESPDGYLYRRVQEDLATNITIHDSETQPEEESVEVEKN